MMKDTDTLDYYPLQKGTVPASSAAMRRISTLPSERQKIFQFDRWYEMFRVSKMALRKKDLPKHYQKHHKLSDQQLQPAIRFIVQKLAAEYPLFFSLTEDGSGPVFRCSLSGDVLRFSKDYAEYLGCKGNEYVDAFDALAMNVPEDIIIYSQLSETEDCVTRAHLMSPAGWGAEWAIGKSFAEIHQDVKKSNGKSVIKHPQGMIKGILRMRETTERVGAISFRTALTLNLHPQDDPGKSWTWDEDQELYIRFERQTVTPIPGINSFLFTVHPYFANLTHPQRIDNAIQALSNIDENSYYRNLLAEKGEQILSFLKERRTRYERMGLFQNQQAL